MCDSGRWLKGTVATMTVIFASLMFLILCSPDALMGWGTTVLVAMVPMQMVVSLLWNGAYPERFAKLAQPWRGCAFLALTTIVGSVVVLLALATVGGGYAAPTPMVNMFLIFTVPVALLLIIPFQAWPFSRFFKTPGLVGVAVLIGTYLLAFALYRLLFNFSFMSEAPFYQPALDPGGQFTAWVPLVLSIASVVVVLALVLLDFWPVVAIARRVSCVGRQPLFGMTAAALVAAGVWALNEVFVVRFAMDLVQFQTNICVSMIFGIFIVLVMFEGMPSLQLPQPWRGFLLLAIAVLLAFAVYSLYHAVAVTSFGLKGGAAPYALELWLASSMLAVTFPAMVVFANYFQFWPFPSRQMMNGCEAQGD